MGVGWGGVGGPTELYTPLRVVNRVVKNPIEF